MFGLSMKDILGLSVVAAIISTIGSLIALVLKDFLLARSLENWKVRLELRKVYERYKHPVISAARAFAFRLIEILDNPETNYLNCKLLDDKIPFEPLGNTTEDIHYQKYKWMSTLYRTASFFGWLELYRRETATLLFPKSKKLLLLNNSIHRIREAFSDGKLNTFTNWIEYRDSLIYREEQSAIGESMILKSESNSPSIIGYAEYCSLITGPKTDQCDWLLRSGHLLNELKHFPQDKDFRFLRLVEVLRAISALILLLDDSDERDNIIELLAKVTLLGHNYKYPR